VDARTPCLLKPSSNTGITDSKLAREEQEERYHCSESLSQLICCIHDKHIIPGKVRTHEATEQISILTVIWASERMGLFLISNGCSRQQSMHYIGAVFISYTTSLGFKIKLAELSLERASTIGPRSHGLGYRQHTSVHLYLVEQRTLAEKVQAGTFPNSCMELRRCRDGAIASLFRLERAATASDTHI